MKHYTKGDWETFSPLTNVMVRHVRWRIEKISDNLNLVAPLLINQTPSVQRPQTPVVEIILTLSSRRGIHGERLL
jgi:hypothetical protein